MNEIIGTQKELIGKNWVKVIRISLFILMAFTFYCLYTYFDGLKVNEFRFKNLLIAISTAVLIMFLPPFLRYKKYLIKKNPSSEI